MTVRARVETWHKSLCNRVAWIECAVIHHLFGSHQWSSRCPHLSLRITEAAIKFMRLSCWAVAVHKWNEKQMKRDSFNCILTHASCVGFRLWFRCLYDPSFSLSNGKNNGSGVGGIPTPPEIRISAPSVFTYSPPFAVDTCRTSSRERESDVAPDHLQSRYSCSTPQIWMIHVSNRWIGAKRSKTSRLCHDHLMDHFHFFN